MTEQDQYAPSDEPSRLAEPSAQRKPWIAPTVTIHSIDEVTKGTKFSTNPDAMTNAIS